MAEPLGFPHPDHAEHARHTIEEGERFPAPPSTWVQGASRQLEDAGRLDSLMEVKLAKHKAGVARRVLKQARSNGASRWTSTGYYASGVGRVGT